MADVAFSDLTELTSLARNDLICGTDTSEGAAEQSKKLQLGTLVDFLIITGQFLRPQFQWKDADEVYIGGAWYDVAGKYAGWTSQLTKSFSGLSASTWYYVYLDYSAITSGTAVTTTEVIYSTTAPTYSHSLRGWYNGNDRCILPIYSDASSNIEEFFHKGDYILYSDNFSEISGFSTSTWTDLTLTMPAISRRAKCTFEATYNSPNGSVFRWRTNGQSGSTGHRAVQVSSATTIGTNTVEVVTDSSQKIEIEEATPSNSVLAVWTDGFYLPIGM